MVVAIRKFLVFTLTLVLACAMGVTSFAEEVQEEVQETIQKPTVTYASQVQDKGWMEPVSDGAMSGTIEEMRRLETLWIRIENATIEGGITYRSYVQGIGWTPWQADGGISGTEGQGRSVQAVEIKLTGALGEQYDVCYRVLVENYGWLDYALNGTAAGTTELPLRMEAIEIQLIPKGGELLGSTAVPIRKLYELRVDPQDGQTYLYHINNTKVHGWYDYNGERYYATNGVPLTTGWHYIDGMKFYIDDSQKLLQNVESLIGKQDAYLIKINKQANCVTIYAKDGAKGFIIPIRSMLCTTGFDTPIGTFKTPEKYRWRLMVNDTYSQYATRIIKGKGFLIHSVGFEKMDNKTMLTDAYNYLGASYSLGCIRLTTGNAKWIYDNCKLGTTVTIYNDPNPGPFYRPEVVKIPNNQKWDPTDPNT